MRCEWDPPAPAKPKRFTKTSLSFFQKKKMWTYRLTAQQIEWVKRWARTQFNYNESQWSDFEGQAFYDGHEGRLLGKAGEVAFCQVTGAPTTELGKIHKCRKKTDGKSKELKPPDVILPNGITIDVKSTRNRRTGINVVHWHEAEFDVYATMLALDDSWTFRFLGWQWSREVIQEKWLRKGTNYKPYYCYPQNLLKEPMSFGGLF